MQRSEIRSPTRGRAQNQTGETPGALLTRLIAGTKRFAPGDGRVASAALGAMAFLVYEPPLCDALPAELSRDLLQVAVEAARSHPADDSVQVRRTGWMRPVLR